MIVKLIQYVGDCNHGHRLTWISPLYHRKGKFHHFLKIPIDEPIVILRPLYPRDADGLQSIGVWKGRRVN